MANPKGAESVELDVGPSEIVWPVPEQEVVGDREGWLAELEFAAFRLGVGVLSRLPRRALDGVSWCLAQLAKRIDRRHANSARDLIATAFNSVGQPQSPAQIERRVTTAYRHLLEVTLTQARLTRRFGRQPEALVGRLDNQLTEEQRGLLSEGRCIIVSAHVGDWEIASQMIGAAGYTPLYVISKPPRNAPMSRALKALRQAYNVRLLPRRGAMASAPAVVQGGGRLAMLLDQRARKNPLMVPFFGRLARCDRSAAVLLKRLRCPIVFLAVYRTGDLQWRMQGDSVMHPHEMQGLSNEDITLRVNQALERLIMNEPDQQFWLHDRYRGAV
jgi:Kdo2-lipid IVA lauroyltransferase/acyltransferase